MPTDLFHPLKRREMKAKREALVEPRRRLAEDSVSQTLPLGQTLRLLSPTGDLLLEIIGTTGAPQIRLPHGDARLDVAGKLNIAAEQIVLESRSLDMKLVSPEDVIVRGRTIRLN